MFEQQVNRVVPLGPPAAYVTYSISTGRDVEVVAACKDVGCEYWRDGWECPVDERTEEGRTWAFMIRHPEAFGESKRDFKELMRGDGVTVFRFAPYQRCFQEHRTVPDLFVARDGDWRGNPTGRGRVHVSGLNWAEDFMEHESALADLRQKG